MFLNAVELKAGPIFAFYKLITGPMFLLFLFVCFENLVLPADRRGFFKNKQQNNQKNTQFYRLKTGPIMLRNILGPIFSIYLDQCLTFKL